MSFFPEALLELPRWTRWKLIQRGERTTKMPIMRNGKPAKVNDPDTWMSYDRVNVTNKGNGVGFVLGDGIGCIDLDNAVSALGEIEEWALDIVMAVPDAAVEISQSARGLHVWGFLDEMPGRNLRSEGLSAEVYSTGRFIAMTGEWLRPRELSDITPLANYLINKESA